MKTTHLEMRPIHVRLENRTKSYAFVAMLAYKIVQELTNRLCNIDMTVEEGIRQIDSICAINVTIGDKVIYNSITEPSDEIVTLLKVADVQLSASFQFKGTIAATSKKLIANLSTHKKLTSYRSLNPLFNFGTSDAIFPFHI